MMLTLSRRPFETPSSFVRDAMLRLARSAMNPLARRARPPHIDPWSWDDRKLRDVGLRRGEIGGDIVIDRAGDPWPLLRR